MKKFVAFAGYACNNRCGFCVHLYRRGVPPLSTRAVVAALAAARADGCDWAELIGGEATVRPDVLTLVAAARRLGYARVAMATNGRMFARPGFARAAVDAGLTDVMLSIHGAEPALHDALTGAPGSLEELLEGAGRLHAAGVPRLSANTTVVRANVGALQGIGRLLLRLGLMQAEFIFVDPSSGGAARDPAAWMPRLFEAAPALRRLLGLGREAGTRGWRVRYVPLCLFRDWLDQVSELRERQAFSEVRHLAPDFYNPDVTASRRESARVRTPRCRGCALADDCEGLWRAYVELWGDAELEPVNA
ncbi:MAG: radical SAM protein [Elusimicrobia bacterium]|nr:radical SAM protein [Elusimicrobiota bacterium]